MNGIMDYLKHGYYVGHDASCLASFITDELIARGMQELEGELALLARGENPAVAADAIEHAGNLLDTIFCAWPDAAERERLFNGYEDAHARYFYQLKKLADGTDARVAQIAQAALDAPSWEEAQDVAADALALWELPDARIVNSPMGSYAIYRGLIERPVTRTCFCAFAAVLSCAQLTDIACIGSTPGIRRMALEIGSENSRFAGASAPSVRLIGKTSIADLVRPALDAGSGDAQEAPAKPWKDPMFPDHSNNFENVQQALEQIRMLEGQQLTLDAKERIWELGDWFGDLCLKYPTHDEREAAYPGLHEAEERLELALRGIAQDADEELARAALMTVRDPATLAAWLCAPWKFDPSLMRGCLWNLSNNPRCEKDLLVKLVTDSANIEVRVALTTDNRHWEDAPLGGIQDALRHLGDGALKQLVRERHDELPWKSAIELIEDQEFLWDLYMDAQGAGEDESMPQSEDDDIRELATMAITNQEHLFQIAMKDRIFLIRLLAVERITDTNLLRRIARESDDRVIASSAEKLQAKLHPCNLPVQ